MNFPYLVMYEQKDKQVIRTFIYAPDHPTALTNAIKVTPRGSVCLSVERLYKVN